MYFQEYLKTILQIYYKKSKKSLLLFLLRKYTNLLISLFTDNQIIVQNFILPVDNL